MVLVQNAQVNVTHTLLNVQEAILITCGWLNCADSVALFSSPPLVTDFLESVLMRWPFKAHFYAVFPIIWAGEGCSSSLMADKASEPYL